MPCKVAIIGRPNVGKSTLFNRMAGKKLALVHDTPGMTRDWREAAATYSGMDFVIVDTAGLEESFDESIESRMRQQTEEAVSRANVAVMVIDARSGITPMDRHFADWLRKRNMPTILLANKCEGRAAEAGMYEAYELGLGDPLPVSAEHGQGMGALYDALKPYLEEAAERDGEQGGGAVDSLQSLEEEAEEEDKASWLEDLSEEEAARAALEGDDEEAGPDDDNWDDATRPIKLAIVGRPNVGKSTLVNALLQEQRVMTGPEPGVTRDAITVNWEYEGREFRLVDTAGLRRKARVHESIERMAVGDTMRAIRLAHVVVLVLDANAVLDKQDLIIASHVIEEGRALIIAVNKWDAAEDRDKSLQRLQDRLQTSLPQAKEIPTVTISALKGRNLDRMLDSVMQIYRTWNMRITTGRLNRWLAGMTSAHPPPLANGRTNKVRYMTQIKSRPPTFAVWVSQPKMLPESYKRYLVNGLRETFGLAGTPIRLNLRTSKNPYIGD